MDNNERISVVSLDGVYYTVIDGYCAYDYGFDTADEALTNGMSILAEPENEETVRHMPIAYDGANIVSDNALLHEIVLPSGTGDEGYMEPYGLMMYDWVCLVCDGTSENLQVDYVRKDGVGFMKTYWVHYFSEIKPIPLTDKILEKNGFSYNHRENAQFKDTDFYVTCYENYYHTDDEEYAEYNRIGIWFVLGNSIMRISYVHQLQQAMRMAGLKEEANNLKI